MEADPRFTVVLATVDDRAREELLHLLGERFCVRALRCEPFGTFEAVHARRPDVVIADAECGAEIVAHLEAGDPPPSTWTVLLAEDASAMLPQGLTRLPADASPRRILAAVSAAGRFARIGIHTRVRPDQQAAAARAAHAGTLAPPARNAEAS